MSTGHQPPSGAELARQMRAARSKKIMLYNLSVTKGSIPMSTAAQAAAWEAVRAASDDKASSFITALKAAEDEQVEAVYLLTTADQIKQLGDDPRAMFKQVTHGRKVHLNCVIFATPADVKADLDQWKKLADGTHGAYLLQAK